MASSTLESGENAKVYKYVRLVRALDISKDLYDNAIEQRELYEKVVPQNTRFDHY